MHRIKEKFDNTRDSNETDRIESIYAAEEDTLKLDWGVHIVVWIYALL